LAAGRREKMGIGTGLKRRLAVKKIAEEERWW